MSGDDNELPKMGGSFQDCLLRFCSSNGMLYSDMGRPVREPNKVWLPHLEVPNPEGDSEDDSYQVHFWPSFRNYVDKDMLCC